MTVLFLGNVTETLDYLREVEDEVIATEEPITDAGADWIVAHGYRHIVSRKVLSSTPAVNIHPSYLPFNRGAHPYLWAIAEGTPNGVSVHKMDAHLDTGPIYARRRVMYLPTDTVLDNRARLQRAATNLFRSVWEAIRNGTLEPTPQVGGGSYHRMADLRHVALPDGLYTRLGDVA